MGKVPKPPAEIALLFRQAVSKATALATAFPIMIMLVTGLALLVGDTARRSIGTGRSDARRKMGYQGEQNGLSETGAVST
jgi:hypothetical protein